MEIYHMETTLKSWNYVYIINFCEWDFGSDVFTFLRRNLQLCWLAPVHYWCPATLCCRNGGRPSVEMCRLDHIRSNDGSVRFCSSKFAQGFGSCEANSEGCIHA